MHFSRAGPWYNVSRITGPRHNFLGIKWSSSSIEQPIETHALPGKCACCRLELNADEVREQVLRGVAEGNSVHQTGFVVSGIQFFTSDSNIPDVYRFLATAIVKRLAHAEPFSEQT
jgi:hypothetical protein